MRAHERANAECKRALRARGKIPVRDAEKRPNYVQTPIFVLGVTSREIPLAMRAKVEATARAFVAL